MRKAIYNEINQLKLNDQPLFDAEKERIMLRLKKEIRVKRPAHTALRYIMGFAGFFMVLGMMPTKKTFFSYIGKHSVYVYVLHCMFIIILRELDEDYNYLGVLTDKWRLLIYCFSGVPLSILFASAPVRKLTKRFVAPDFDLKRIIKRLADIEEKETK